MDVAELSEWLARAQRAVEQGEAHIQRQRAVIARQEMARQDATDARALLKTLLERQARRTEHLALLMRQFPAGS
jgi:hypothetical protein